jgi:hypothetical protein
MLQHVGTRDGLRPVQVADDERGGLNLGEPVGGGGTGGSTTPNPESSLLRAIRFIFQTRSRTVESISSGLR